MSFISLMNTDELLELAPLDALGLLDKHDAALFERAFLSATKEVQHLVRELQASVAADPSLMSGENPPRDLQERVLARLSTEIRRSTEELAPLAIIGPGSAKKELERRRATHTGWFGSAALWRAAAFVCAAGVVTSLYFSSTTAQRYKQLANDAIQRDIPIEVFRQFGQRLAVIHARAGVKFPLASTSGAPSSQIALVGIDAQSSTVTVYALGLKRDGESYTFRVVDPNTNTVITSAELKPTFDGVAANGAKFDSAKLALVQAARFEIVNDAGTVVLTTMA